jgi:hypothetical protein
MVNPRAALKRKAVEALEPFPVEKPPTIERLELEDEFWTKYWHGFIRRPDYAHLMAGVSNMIRDGAAE